MVVYKGVFDQWGRTYDNDIVKLGAHIIKSEITPVLIHQDVRGPVH